MLRACKVVQSLCKLHYYLDESDPDIAVVRRQDDSFDRGRDVECREDDLLRSPHQP
jgi:hypothetical protein